MDTSQGIVFGSKFSKWIAGMYFAIIAFLAFMLVYMPLIIIFIVVKAYRMKFTVTPDQIIVSGVFKENRINIAEIQSTYKTPILFGFRLFGASFLGGWYYLPGVGKAWVTMSNFQDGVLISIKKGKNFVITPEEPYEFIRTVEERKK